MSPATPRFTIERSARPQKMKWKAPPSTTARRETNKNERTLNITSGGDVVTVKEGRITEVEVTV